jgi:predicted transcriptional regulator
MGTTYTTNALSGTRETIDIDWDRLEEALGNLNKQPDGAFTIGDYAKRTGKTESSAKVALNKLVSAGVLERTTPAFGKKAHFWFKESE